MSSEEKNSYENLPEEVIEKFRYGYFGLVSRDSTNLTESLKRKNDLVGKYRDILTYQRYFSKSLSENMIIIELFDPFYGNEKDKYVICGTKHIETADDICKVYKLLLIGMENLEPHVMEWSDGNYNGYGNIFQEDWEKKKRFVYFCASNSQAKFTYSHYVNDPDKYEEFYENFYNLEESINSIAEDAHRGFLKKIENDIENAKKGVIELLEQINFDICIKFRTKKTDDLSPISATLGMYILNDQLDKMDRSLNSEPRNFYMKLYRRVKKLDLLIKVFNFFQTWVNSSDYTEKLKNFTRTFTIIDLAASCAKNPVAIFTSGYLKVIEKLSKAITKLQKKDLVNKLLVYQEDGVYMESMGYAASEPDSHVHYFMVFLMNCDSDTEIAEVLSSSKIKVYYKDSLNTGGKSAVIPMAKVVEYFNDYRQYIDDYLEERQNKFTELRDELISEYGEDLTDYGDLHIESFEKIPVNSNILLPDEIDLSRFNNWLDKHKEDLWFLRYGSIEMKETFIRMEIVE